MNGEDRAELTNAEMWHNICEADISRFEDFKSGLENSITPENGLAVRINSSSPFQTPKTPRYEINGKTYEFFRVGNEVFAIPAGMAGKIRPIPMGSTPEEFLDYLKKIKEGAIKPEAETEY